MTENERKREFERYFREHDKLIYGTVLRMTGDVTAAEDIRQRTFEIFFKKMEEALEDGNVGGWLLTVAEQEVKHYRRKWARKFRFEVGLEECAEVAAPP